VLIRLSVEGFEMWECRRNFLDFLKAGRRDKWANYCMAHWINELGGLGGVW
jgi:hypothetical protein